MEGKIKKHEHSRGFTLTEIVLVLFVLGILISGVLPLFLNVITANKNAEYYSKAYKIADSKIEELRAIPFDNLTSQTVSISDLPQGQVVLNITNQIDGAAQTDIKKADLRINWNFKRPQSIRIITLVGRNGLRR